MLEWMNGMFKSCVGYICVTEIRSYTAFIDLCRLKRGSVCDHLDALWSRFLERGARSQFTGGSKQWRQKLNSRRERPRSATLTQTVRSHILRNVAVQTSTLIHKQADYVKRTRPFNICASCLFLWNGRVRLCKFLQSFWSRKEVVFSVIWHSSLTVLVEEEVIVVTSS